ncbi:ATP-binding protein [Pyrobaculum aerophilum]|uniref:ATP-binding protein n=1 Tax=Pyrobaculum aerophilum TaxID=13773 RepID=UPI0023F3A11B|nr:ATP-binding protein [Pyrobaculum aerophilum]MCX8137589.1 ATP-binding protein [Pyrobaculum aerophilum]
MRRIKSSLAVGLSVEFVDRELALKRVEEWAERGTRLVQVVYGPEGCGKSTWLKQSAELLKDLGFYVIYVNPLQREYAAYVDVKDVVRRLAEAAAERSGVAEVKLADLAVQLATFLIKKKRRKIAILADDVFQAIGVDKAASYVKWMLSVIEHPPGEYERIVAIATTSEGATRRVIGRHTWAIQYPMWNMGREGFHQLFEQIPSAGLSEEEAWGWTGGNPRMLGELHAAGWNVEEATRQIVEMKRLAAFATSLTAEEEEWLEEALEDPDALFTRERLPLLERLVDLNLVIDTLPERDARFWIDAPPPEKSGELGIGRHVAWQTPLHREAVRRSLRRVATK